MPISALVIILLLYLHASGIWRLYITSSVANHCWGFLPREYCSQAFYFILIAGSSYNMNEQSSSTKNMSQIFCHCINGQHRVTPQYQLLTQYLELLQIQSLDQSKFCLFTIKRGLMVEVWDTLNCPQGPHLTGKCSKAVGYMPTFVNPIHALTANYQRTGDSLISRRRITNRCV